MPFAFRLAMILKPPCESSVRSLFVTFVVAMSVLATGRDTALAQLAPPAGHPTGIVGEKDHRIRVPSDQWPWSAIGRINIVAGTSHLGMCTGTLVGPRQVLTAAHCLFDTRTNDWVKPNTVHFVAGQTQDKFLGHSIAESFATSPQFKFNLEDRPRYDFIASDMIRHDWAILTLRDALNIKPIPIQTVDGTELSASANAGKLTLAGYALDRPYMLSVHQGCSATIDPSEPGVITHMCDSAPGESGAPLLLLRDGSGPGTEGAVVIGLHSANSQRFESQVGYQALAGHGVSAAEFAAAAQSSQR